MADRKRHGGLKRTTGIDPAVQKWREDAATNPAALSAKQRRERQRVRVNFDIPEDLKAALTHISDRDQEDTSLSQAAALLLGWAMKEYLEGNQEIHTAFREAKSPARTPKFAWNLDMPESWASVWEVFSFNGEVSGEVNITVDGE
jgi:hypothetical protein